MQSEIALDLGVDDLVRQSQAGDRQAFAELVRRFERIALAVAYAVVGDGHGAGDATQEAFVKSWQRLGDLREPEKFGAWLCGIVRRSAHDVRRRGLREARLHAGLERDHQSPEPGVDPATEFARKEATAEIRGALGTLDELARSIVVLRYFEGLSSRQIGAMLDLSAAAVDMRLMRARTELRRVLERIAE